MARTTEIIPLMSPAPGTSRHLKVHRYGTPAVGPKAYLHSSLHADEWPGLLTLHHLMVMLDKADLEKRITGEIVLLPFANPIGLSQRVNGSVLGRFNLDGSGNFNRGWPSLTEDIISNLEEQLGDDPAANVDMMRNALREAVANLPRESEITQLQAQLLSLSIDADIVLDLHCDSIATLHVYANQVHEDEAMLLAAELGSPVVLLEEAPGGGPFDEANHAPWIKTRDQLNLGEALPAACFSTTVELRGSHDVNDEYAKADADALLRFMMRKGVVEGDPGPAPAPACKATPLDGVDMVKSPGTGLVAWQCQIGEFVNKGDVIAELVDIEAEDPATARTPIRTETSGVLFARKATTLIRSGDNLCKIAGSEKLASRQSGPLLSP